MMARLSLARAGGSLPLPLPLIAIYALLPLAYALLMLGLGQNPLEVLGAVFHGAFGSAQGLNRTLARATPLLLLSAGLLVAFRAKFWYIGANGAMIVGAIAASGIALYNPDGPGWLFLPLMLLGALLAGAAWGLVPGLLRVGFGAPEIIVSLMLNYVAQRLLEFLAISYWRDPGGRGFPGSATFNPEYWLPRLPGTNLHLGLLFGLLALVGVAILLRRTVLGLEIELLGQGTGLARYVGLPVQRRVLLVAALAGALGGLAGAVQVAGLNYRLEAGVSQDLGYTAILVVSLAALRPWAAGLCSLLVAGLLVGSDALQIQFGLPTALSGLLLWAILYAAIATQAARSG